MFHRETSGLHYFIFLRIKKKAWPLMRLDRDTVIHNLCEGRVEHPLVLLDLRGKARNLPGREKTILA
jgi:hypothetical protein